MTGRDMIISILPTFPLGLDRPSPWGTCWLMLMKVDTYRGTRCLFSFASKALTGRKSSSENKPVNIPVNECVWNTLKIWRNSDAVCKTGFRSF